jgi:uncharacterized membrane protein YgdD (TMEM256/DUF423 family)
VSPRTWVVAGAVLGALAVATGAFGAHGLKDRLAAQSETGVFDATSIYETACRYHMYHALALVLVGLLALHAESLWLNVAGASFAAGILIFCGLLYALALGGPRILGAIVPIGGLAFIVGWVALAFSAAAVARK